MTVNFVVVTDNLQATLDTMNAFSPAPTKLGVTPGNLIVWSWYNANPSDVDTVQNADYSYASVELP